MKTSLIARLFQVIYLGAGLQLALLYPCLLPNFYFFYYQRTKLFLTIMLVPSSTCHLIDPPDLLVVTHASSFSNVLFSFIHGIPHATAKLVESRLQFSWYSLSAYTLPCLSNILSPEPFK